MIMFGDNPIEDMEEFIAMHDLRARNECPLNDYFGEFKDEFSAVILPRHYVIGSADAIVGWVSNRSSTGWWWESTTGAAGKAANCILAAEALIAHKGEDRS
jgi:hypothetical protein